MNLRYTPWYDAYLLLAAGGAVWTALGCGISPFWILLLFPAYLLGLCLAHILVFVLLSFVIRRRGYIPRARRICRRRCAPALSWPTIFRTLTRW